MQTLKKKLKKVLAKEVFEVYCPECGWYGMSDDCPRLKCRNCGMTVKKYE